MSTPFTLSPNPLSMYLTPLIKRALMKCRLGIDHRQGLTCILGDPGLGKSTILRYLYAEYGAKPEIKATLIPTPDFNSEYAMLKSICQDFGLPPKRSIVAQNEEFQSFLVECGKEGQNVLVFVDEAQKLTNRMLEQVRTMLNFETNTGKLVQIVLAGQLELKERLLREENAGIKSRIYASSLMEPLLAEEMAGMIDYRCKLAEIKNPFPAPSLEEIFNLTQGVPRDVLKVCDLSYAMAQMMKLPNVTPEIVTSAYEEGTDALRKAAHE
jgi:general secretion pathway protein A